MGDHKHGSMDCTEQRKTFHGFLKIAMWTAVTTVVILIFLAFVGT